MELPEGVILGGGNPLLDLIVHVDKKILNKWGLKENDSRPCTAELEGIFEEIEELTPKCEPGGTVNNTATIFQWIVGQEKRFTILGTVGQDSAGQELIKKMKMNGVNPYFKISPLAPTGKCAILITDQNRSMCTLLGASKLFSSDILSDPTVMKLVETAKYFYLSCQFFNASADFIHRIGEHSFEHRKTFCLNLGSPLAQRRFSKEIEKLLPVVNIIFGNREELLALGEAHGLVADVKSIILTISGQQNSPKTLVITQAKDPVIVCNNGQITEYAVPNIPRHKILDTSGAGDSFVGGFLSQYVQGKPLEVCVKCGNYAASQIIQQYGCKPPSDCDWKS